MEDKKRKELLSKPTSYLLFGTAGFLFLFFCLTGRELAERGNILWTGSYLFRTLGLSLVLGGALGGGICYLFRRAAVRAGEEGGKGRAPGGKFRACAAWL